MSQYENIYSPQTMGIAAAQETLAIARRDVEQRYKDLAKAMIKQQDDINRQQKEIDKRSLEMAKVEAKNWNDAKQLEFARVEISNENSVILRDKERIAQKEERIELLEGQRRRNRTVSECFIEDTFRVLKPSAVVEHVTNSSLKVRKHAMDNISACIAGFKDNPPATFVRFAPADIAPDILPKLHQLVSISTKPVESVVQFAESIISNPPMARALALAGQCSKLAEYLVEPNEIASRLAICAFRQMVVMDASIVKPAYEALERAIPRLPIQSPAQSPHPAVDFIKEIAPRIVEDCFNNGFWLTIAPLVNHHVESIRHIVLRKIILLSQHSDRNQHGVAEAHILSFLDVYYQSASPPTDVIDFFVELLPLVAEKMCRRTERTHWLLTRLGDENAKIITAIISAFRVCVQKQDHEIYEAFVEVKVLRRLSEPPIQQSPSITKLLCQMLPVLAIPHARAKAVDDIVAFLEHNDPTVADACMLACTKIIHSTLDDRKHLFSVFMRLNHAKESTLKLCDQAMPVFCKDWAASDDFTKIIGYLQHSEKRIRLPALQVWRDLVTNSPATRTKIVHDGHLEVLFDLCASQYEDVIVFGSQCCAPMSLEITRAGVAPTQKLVDLLNHPKPIIRQAVLRAVQATSGSNDTSCAVLLEAGLFRALHLFLEMYPADFLDNAAKILTRFVPFLCSSPDACAGLLQLLESSSSVVENAARSALNAISNMDISERETLRGAVINRLQLPTSTIVEYAVKAIYGWVGPDLAQANDFTTLLGLAFHSETNIQTATLVFLKSTLSNVDYQESLEKVNMVYMLRALSASDNPEALNFVPVALRMLALSLARNGHVIAVMDFLVHSEPKIRDGAAAALEVIANSSSIHERKQLLKEDLIVKVVNTAESLNQSQLQVLTSIIPKLSFDYLDAGRINVVISLVDHAQQLIRSGAIKALATIVDGTAEQRLCLRNALLPRLQQASPLLCEVAANCLTRALAQDLIYGGNFMQVFELFKIDDTRVREPIVEQLKVYINASDEAGRRRLVEAGILQAIIHAYTSTKEDLINLLTTSILPSLGPSLTQNNGAMLFPLFSHDEPRIRTAAIQALKNAIDSRHGNMESLAKTFIIGTLYPMTSTDDAIGDVWCRLLPKVAPFLSNRTDIDILFGCINDNKEKITQAASEAVSIMARTSDLTRNQMFPTLLHHLEKITPKSLPLIARGVSLSGFTFMFHGKEVELVQLLSDENFDIVTASVEALIQVMAKGSSADHQKLLKANVFEIALTLHDQQSQTSESLRLLRGIIQHLSYAMVLDERLGREVLSLFDDPDASLSDALYQAWSSDPRIYESPSLANLLPLLLQRNKLDDKSVIALLCQLAPHMVPKLISSRSLNIIAEVLRTKDADVARAFLKETCNSIKNATETEKGWFVSEPSFVTSIGEHLQGQDTAMRQDSSAIIRLLSHDSPSRSGLIMNQGIGKYLSWVASNGESGARQTSLRALYSLFMAAPDYAERLVTDSLPSLYDILKQDGLIIGVHTKALELLNAISQQTPHPLIIESGIIEDLVRWSSPRHSVRDAKCKEFTFRICQAIAQQSDTGRQALISAGILPELVSLSTSRTPSDVINACNIIKALAYTGTFEGDLSSAGVKDAMENILSPFKKSTLQKKEDKILARAAAKDALDTVKLTKCTSLSKLSPSASKLPRSRSTINLLSLSKTFSRGVPSDANVEPYYQTQNSASTGKMSNADITASSGSSPHHQRSTSEPAMSPNKFEGELSSGPLLPNRRGRSSTFSQDDENMASNGNAFRWPADPLCRDRSTVDITQRYLSAVQETDLDIHPVRNSQRRTYHSRGSSAFVLQRDGSSVQPSRSSTIGNLSIVRRHDVVHSASENSTAPTYRTTAPHNPVGGVADRPSNDRRHDAFHSVSSRTGPPTYRSESESSADEGEESPRQ